MTGTLRTIARVSCALGVILVAGGIAPAQQDKRMLALFALEPGQWEMRAIGSDRIRPRSVCLGDPSVLIQLEHRQATCSQLVVVNQPHDLTVHYVCPINGFGQTSIRIETPRIARIDTQGIAANAPFAYRAELRRVGPCAQQGRLPR